MKTIINIPLTRIICLLILITLVDLQVSAQVKVYEMSLKKDAVHLGVGISLNALGIILQNKVDAATAEEISLLDRNDVWAFDRGATFNSSSAAGSASDIILYSSMAIPFLTYLNKECRSEEGAVAIMAIETFLYTNGITSISKGLFSRLRPFAYNPDFPLDKKLEQRAKLSFFSGHASATAAFSFFSAKIITDLHPDLNNKWLIWASAATIPAVIGVLRYEAGKHYPSDIITGYAVGAIIGYLVPESHLSKRINLTSNANGGISLFISLN